MIDFSSKLLEDLYIKAQTLEDKAVDRLFDEVWKMLNQSQGAVIEPLLHAIKNWAEKTAPQTRFRALAEFTLGYAFFFNAHYPQSVIQCLQAITLFRELDNEDGIAISNVVLGNSYRSMGANDLAIQCYLRARQHQNGIYPVTDLGSSYQLAEVYVELGNYKDALPLLKQALQLVRRNNFAAWWEPRIINSTANALVKSGQTNKGLAAFKSAYKISKRDSFPAVAARVLTDMAEYYAIAGNQSRAIRYNQEALTIRLELNIQNAIISNMLNLATIYEQLGKDEKALQHLWDALPIAINLGMKAKIARIHELLSKTFERDGKIAESLTHYKAFHKVKAEASLEDAEQKIKNYRQIVEAEQTARENSVIRKQKAEIEDKNAQLQLTIDELVLAKDQIRFEKQRSDNLLLNILPAEVADELKAKGSAKARQYNDVTVIFTDFKGFTTVAEQLSPEQLVQELHVCFSAFDAIMEKYGVEKIKTVGDAYLAICGLPLADKDHAINTLAAANAIRDFIKYRKLALGDRSFDIRIGVHSGDVVAGIVGVKKFAYDIWGDTVNTAARMEQNSEPGKINVSETTYQLAKKHFNFTYRGEILAKNKGYLKMYFLE